MSIAGQRRNLVQTIEESVRRLDGWLERNGWAGYDPYDIKATGLYARLVDSRFAEGVLPLRALRKGFLGFEQRFPLLARQLLGVRKNIIPKAMGLFARGYLDLYEVTGEERFKTKALECLDWLLEHPCSGYSGLCWGLPFDWQSFVFFPAGTPYAIVTAIIGDAFWRAYRLFDENEYLAACESVCRFFVNDLRTDAIDSTTLCLSYTPLDDFHVHNVNLHVAECLTRVGKEIRNGRYVELGRKAAEYALREQNPDGSLFYWGRAQDPYAPRHIDHYHAGFEIRMLHAMWTLTGDERYHQAAAGYYAFYRRLLFSPDGSPKTTLDRAYPIDIHACAEAILCNATLAKTFPDARELLPEVVKWVIANMQTQKGWFAFEIIERGSRKYKVNVPYIRWGQAWMLRALTEALAALGGER